MMYGQNVPRGPAENTQNIQNASLEYRNSEAKRSTFSCSACNFSCKSFQNYKMHIEQTNHEDLEKIETQNPSAINKPENQKMNPSKDPETKKMDTTKNPDNQKTTIKKNPGTLPGQIRKTLFCLTDYMHRTDREPLIGLEYVLEYKVRTKANNIEPKYACELCYLETDVVPMVEHLTGFRHRKLYLAKEYPYVLKVPTISKESRCSFVRRMALEIEREEGTKMYKIDNVVRMESTNVKTVTNQSKRKTRWNIDGNQSQTRKNKALEYLESFEIDNDSEAVIVTELASNLTAALKFGSEKLKEEALFPVRVARAKDVAMSLMQNVSGDRKTLQKPMLNMPPQFNRGLPEKNSMQVPQKPQQFPFVPSNQKQNIPNLSMPSTTGSAQFSQNDQFLNKFMAFLKCLPQNTTSTGNVQMNSQLMMLKSLLLDQTPNSDNLQQKMMMQVAALAQNTGNPDMGSLNQQLMSMSSQNPTAMEISQLYQNALMQMAGVIRDTPNTGNMPMNQNFVSNLYQGVQNQQYGQAGSSSLMQMNQNAYQNQNLNTQPEYAGASQSYGNFGYDRSVEGNYLPQADPFSTQYDGFAESGIYRADKQTRTPYSEMSHESGMHGRKWNEPGSAREQAPYTRVSLSSNSMAPTSNTHEIYNSRQFDLPEWGDRESDILHSKRARLDMDPIPPNYPEDYYLESRQPHGINPADLSTDIRDRIRGRDEFTVSAILSEYADNRPPK